MVPLAVLIAHIIRLILRKKYSLEVYPHYGVLFALFTCKAPSGCGGMTYYKIV